MVSLTALDRFAIALEGLCRVVAARMHRDVLVSAVLMLVWRRVRGVEARIRGLMARFRAGRVLVRSALRTGGRRGVQVVGSAALPRGFAWLLPLVPFEAAGFAGQLRAVLAEPEMIALLAASAEARRVLRPLCRMLGIEAGVLAPVVAAVEAPGEGAALVDGDSGAGCGAFGDGSPIGAFAVGLRPLTVGVARSPPDG